MAFVNRCFLTYRTGSFTVRTVLLRRYLSANGQLEDKDEPTVEKGLVIGVYEADEKQSLGLSEAATLLDQKNSGRISELLNISGFTGKLGKSRVLYDIEKDMPCIAVVGLGKANEPDDELEELDGASDTLRQAAAVGARTLRDVGVKNIYFDPCHNAQAVAEGACLGLHTFEQFKSPKKQKCVPNIFVLNQSNNLSISDLWNQGLVFANGQNFAKELMELPANHLTPTIFSESTADRLSKTGKVEIHIRDETWAENMRMFSFLSVGKGSSEPSVLLEMKYNGADNADEQPIVLVGKGVTFDSGGISLKPSAGMKLMRGDMGGAATVTAALEAIVQLQLPINVIALTPLCENLPSGTANKPGDVITAMNGKAIEIDNTDAEGRLILADALCYAHTFNPQVLVDVATLTGAIDVALGTGATGVYTNCSLLWTHLQQAGYCTGDRMWRMPLFKCYTKDIQSDMADVMNVSKKKGSAGSCTAATFLKEFVEMPCWAHLDIAGVMSNTDDVPYLGKGMSGRPTRTLVELISRLSRGKN